MVVHTCVYVTSMCISTYACMCVYIHLLSTSPYMVTCVCVCVCVCVCMHMCILNRKEIFSIGYFLIWAKISKSHIVRCYTTSRICLDSSLLR